jgi:hypothetical protein
MVMITQILKRGQHNPCFIIPLVCKIKSFEPGSAALLSLSSFFFYSGWMEKGASQTNGVVWPGYGFEAHGRPIEII